MFEVLTAAEMRKADAATISGGIPGLQLMEAAGTSVAARIRDQYEPCPVLVLCGPGNNGGDGFVIARCLKEKGWPVRLACLVKKTALKGDAAQGAHKWDGEAEALNSNLSLRQCGLVVDAVFGTGFSGALEPEIVTLFEKIRGKSIPVVAVDIPSGIDATTGHVADGTLKSALTVTFCRKKIAHMIYPARAFCGKIYVASIGISDETVAGLNTSVFENNPALWLKDFPLPDSGSHKFSRGHAVIFGGASRTGAARLAAAAAQRIGAGLVTIASRPESALVYSLYRASLMVDVWSDLEEFRNILRDERKNALLIGPGAGMSSATRDAVLAALVFNKSGVLDADVFSVFKDDPGTLFEKLSPRYVLTPHEGEFERLFGSCEGNKLQRALGAAKTAKAILLLKGADTVIAAPDGTAVISTGAPATLATAGSGDVLAGMITGLVAQGMPPFMAACAGVWLHGEAAKIHGLGLTPEDIIFNISQGLNKIFNIQNPER